jgi:hypothetical protein
MPTRPTHAFKVPAGFTLATADDLNGTNDGTQYLDVSGKMRVIYVQHNNGTAGTVGIDAITISKDGGVTFGADPTLLALASDDVTGTVVANGVLNAAGVEPVNAAIFKGGPYLGQVKVRCARNSADDANSAAWTTGAPSVIAITVG